jgi:hypothetical protein
MREDYADLRFTDSSGNLLPHYVEEFDTSQATCWVRVPSIPPQGASIYMHYGNPDAASLSYGSATFDLFLDFEDGDLSGWADETGALSIDGVAREGSISLKWDSDLTATIEATYPCGLDTEVRDLVVEWSAMAEAKGSDDLYMSFSLPGGTVYTNFIRETDGQLYLGSSSTGYNSGYVFPQNLWHDFHVVFKPSSGLANYWVTDPNGNLLVSKDDVQISNADTTDRRIRIAHDQWYYQHRIFRFDRIRIRKYAEVEPQAVIW